MTPRKPTRAKALGVSDDEYARLLAAQGGHCALCPNRPGSRRLHVDHDHMSKPPRVRGLLCHRCNRALPTWITVEWLMRAARYVCAARGHVRQGVSSGMSDGLWSSHCTRCGTPL